MSKEGVIVDEMNKYAPATPPSAPESPNNNNKVKLYCSHGGKILPSSANGQLKYVGGETRLVSVYRDISFQELMKKLTYQIDDEMVLKYQLVLEDLDSLVSVKSDDDLRNMFEEYDRYVYGSTGAPKLRVFLFPAKSVVVESGQTEFQAPEQRYLDAINGIVRAPTKRRQATSLNLSSLGPYSGWQNSASACSSPRSLGSFGLYPASGCSSPRSPESYTSEAVNPDIVLPNNYLNGTTNMHKVQSSPNICAQADCQRPGSPKTHSCFHHYQNYRQHPRGYQFIKPLGSEKLISVRSVGRADGLKYQVDQASLPERLISIRSVGRTDGIKYQMDPIQQYYYPSSLSSRNSCN